MKQEQSKKLSLHFLLMVVAAFCLVSVLGHLELADAASKAKLNKTSKTLYVGQTYNLKVTGTKSEIKWSTSNKKVATVSSKGFVTAKKAGKATISAKVGKKTLKCKVTVKNPKLNKTKLQLNAGKKCTLKLTGAVGKVKWATSNKKVATVTQKGTVAAKGRGTATISVKVNGKTLKCKVTVTQLAKSVKLNKTELTLKKKKQTYLLLATVSPKNANSQKVTWKSSNTKVATVNQYGSVKAVGNGTCTITATTTDAAKKKATCKVTVKIPEAGTVETEQPGQSVGKEQETEEPTPTVTPKPTVTPTQKPTPTPEPDREPCQHDYGETYYCSDMYPGGEWVYRGTFTASCTACQKLFDTIEEYDAHHHTVIQKISDVKDSWEKWISKKSYPTFEDYLKSYAMGNNDVINASMDTWIIGDWEKTELYEGPEKAFQEFGTGGRIIKEEIKGKIPEDLYEEFIGQGGHPHTGVYATDGEKMTKCSCGEYFNTYRACLCHILSFEANGFSGHKAINAYDAGIIKKDTTKGKTCIKCGDVW